MTINTYADLIGEISDVLAVEELTEKAPTFIQLAEARFDRLLNTLPQEVRAIHTFEEDTDGTFSKYVTIPFEFSGVRRLTLIADPSVSMTYMTPQALDQKYVNQTSGIPRDYSIEGVEIVVGPTPDSDYQMEQIFTRDLRPLSNEDGETSNWLLRQAPDVYLYQSLVMAEAYLIDDNRVGIWKTLADESIAELLKWDRDNRTPTDIHSVHDIPMPFTEHG